MALTTDEQAMSAALHELSDTQPDAPVDRFDGVRRRHLRRRRIQAGVAAAVAVFAVMGVALAMTDRSPSHSTQPTHRTTPAWALPWRDNLDPALSPLRPAALAAWKSNTYGSAANSFYDPRQLVWYLTRPVADGHDAMVVFEVERDDGEHRLVAGLHDLSTPGDDTQNWRLYDVAAPDPRSSAPALVSLYDPVSSGGALPRNWVAVFTDPSAPSVFLREGATTQVQLRDGFANADLGALRGQLSVEVETRSGNRVPRGVVGLAGAPESQIPVLEPPAALVGVPVGEQIGAGSGQGNIIDVNQSLPARVRTAIYARCYGDASIQIAVDRDTGGVSIPCDDKQHEFTGPTTTDQQREYGPGGHAAIVHASKLTAFQFAVVIR